MAKSIMKSKHLNTGLQVDASKARLWLLRKQCRIATGFGVNIKGTTATREKSTLKGPRVLPGQSLNAGIGRQSQCSRACLISPSPYVTQPALVILTTSSSRTQQAQSLLGLQQELFFSFSSILSPSPSFLSLIAFQPKSLLGDFSMPWYKNYPWNHKHQYFNTNISEEIVLRNRSIISQLSPSSPGCLCQVRKCSLSGSASPMQVCTGTSALLQLPCCLPLIPEL